MKVLLSRLSGLVIAAMICVKLFQIVLLLTGARHADPASGRTVPVIIASEISRSPTYINPGQAWLLGSLFGVILLCGMAWMAIGWWEKRGATP